MGTLTVAVYWGPRPETPLAQAGRWLDLLGRLDRLAGVAVDWRWDVDGEEAPGARLPSTKTEFAEALIAANPQDDADLIGWTGQVVGAHPAGGQVRVRVRAGGEDEVSPFHAVLDLVAPPGAQDVSPPLAGHLPETLAAAAGSWDADTGLTYDRDVFGEVKRAYGLRPSSPRAGWAVFLSAHRAALVPASLPGRRLAADHDGVVLDLADAPGGRPSTATVVSAHKELTDCGALERRPQEPLRAKL